MTTATIINKDVPGRHRGEWWHFEYKGRYYIASHSTFMFADETLVFESNEKGEVVDWTDLAGGAGYTHEEAIDDLIQIIDSETDE